MTIVVRVLQGLLILAGLVACVTAVSMAGTVYDDVDGHCYMREVPQSNDEVPAPECAIVSVHQAQAISAGAIGLAGIGAMIGAVAMNGMAPRGAAKRPAQASPYGGYGPPPGPPQPYAQGPHPGPQPPYGPPS